MIWPGAQRLLALTAAVVSSLEAFEYFTDAADSIPASVCGAERSDIGACHASMLQKGITKSARTAPSRFSEPALIDATESTSTHTGATAPLDEEGYTDVLTLQSKRETETYLRRVFQDLDVKIMNEEKFRNYAAWIGTDGELQDPLHHFSALEKDIKNLASQPCGWVSVNNRTVSFDGKSAPLDEDGYRTVASLRSSSEMSAFIGRLIDQEGLYMVDKGGLLGILPFHNCEKEIQSLGRLRDEMRGVAESVDGWVSRTKPKTSLALSARSVKRKQEPNAISLHIKGAAPNGAGSSAEITEDGYYEVATLKSNIEMSVFILRVISDMSLEVVHEAAFTGLVPFYSGVEGFQTLELLKKELKKVSKEMCPWVVPLNFQENQEHTGRSAPINEGGYKAVANMHSPIDMRDYLFRVLKDMKMAVINKGGLMGFLPFHDCENGAKTLKLMREEVYEASKKRSWVRPMEQKEIDALKKEEMESKGKEDKWGMDQASAKGSQASESKDADRKVKPDYLNTQNKGAVAAKANDGSSVSNSAANERAGASNNAPKERPSASGSVAREKTSASSNSANERAGGSTASTNAADSRASRSSNATNERAGASNNAAKERASVSNNAANERSRASNNAAGERSSASKTVATERSSSSNTASSGSSSSSSNLDNVLEEMEDSVDALEEGDTAAPAKAERLPSNADEDLEEAPTAKQRTFSKTSNSESSDGKILASNANDDLEESPSARKHEFSKTLKSEGSGTKGPPSNVNDDLEESPSADQIEYLKTSNSESAEESSDVLPEDADHAQNRWPGAESAEPTAQQLESQLEIANDDNADSSVDNAGSSVDAHGSSQGTVGRLHSADQQRPEADIAAVEEKVSSKVSQDSRSSSKIVKVAPNGAASNGGKAVFPLAAKVAAPPKADKPAPKVTGKATKDPELDLLKVKKKTEDAPQSRKGAAAAPEDKKAAASQKTDKHPVDLLKVKKIVTEAPAAPRKGEEPKPAATSKHAEKEKIPVKTSGLSPKKIHKAELLEARIRVDNTASESAAEDTAEADSVETEIEELEKRLASLKKEDKKKKNTTPEAAKTSAAQKSKASSPSKGADKVKKASGAAPKQEAKKQRKAK